MPVNQKPQWTAVEIASHAMEATSLSQLTLPEVQKMAGRILADQENAPKPNKTDPKPATNAEVMKAMRDDLSKL